MKWKLFFSVVGLFFVSSCFAENYFQRCNIVMEKRNYSKLKTYFEAKDISTVKVKNKSNYAHLCQRLNNNEFLYTDRDINYNSVFFYCFSNKNNTLTCEKERSSAYYPGLSIERIFFGKNNKQFVLFKTNLLRRGIKNNGLLIFHIVPKSDSKRGYAFYSLKGVGAYNGLYSDAGRICSNLSKNSNAKVPHKNHYKILNENSEKISLIFYQKIQSCNNDSTISNQTLEYIWKNNKFRLLRDIREYK